MSQSQLVNEVRRRAQTLADLMKDPEPGLAGWAAQVAFNAGYIADWWEGRLAGTVAEEPHMANLTRRETVQT